MQDQLLDAPIEDFGREYHVFGRAGLLVDPAELLELLAGFAEHTEHLAVEREGLSVDGLQYPAIPE